MKFLSHSPLFFLLLLDLCPLSVYYLKPILPLVPVGDSRIPVPAGVAPPLLTHLDQLLTILFYSFPLLFISPSPPILFPSVLPPFIPISLFFFLSLFLFYNLKVKFKVENPSTISSQRQICRKLRHRVGCDWVMLEITTLIPFFPPNRLMWHYDYCKLFFPPFGIQSKQIDRKKTLFSKKICVPPLRTAYVYMTRRRYKKKV